MKKEKQMNGCLVLSLAKAVDANIREGTYTY